MLHGSHYKQECNNLIIGLARLHVQRRLLLNYTLYAVKVQRSLAPLSRFRGSHIHSAHEQQCCRFQSYANSVRSPMKFTSEIYIAWTTFLESTTTYGPRDHELWRRTLTAYSPPGQNLANTLECTQECNWNVINEPNLVIYDIYIHIYLHSHPSGFLNGPPSLLRETVRSNVYSTLSFPRSYFSVTL